MDHNIEWLFEEVYKIQKKTPNEKLFFISDWDFEGEEVIEFKKLLIRVYNNASQNSFKYNFSYEQFALKEQILDYALQRHSLRIDDTNITIVPNSTISLFAVANALNGIGVKRILVITPTYFSVHETLKKNGLEIFYYHLKDRNNLKIDFQELETIIKEQYIEGILLTDPIYSVGIELTIDEYIKLSALCTAYDLYIIVDYSLGGLNWESNKEHIFNNEKISILIKNEKYVFIDSLAKRLQLNGLKFSIIIGDLKIIDKIDISAELIYGALSSAQCYLIKELYSVEKEGLILDLCRNNLVAIKNNYALIKSLIANTDFDISNTDSGFFALINHKSLRLDQIDTKEYLLQLLQKDKIICLTKDKLSYFPSNNFGFRVNLSKKGDELLFPIRQCVGMNYNRFQKR